MWRCTPMSSPSRSSARVATPDPSPVRTGKKALLKMIRFSGLPFLFREVLQRRRVSILVFHDITPPAADRAFAYLVKHYNVISLRRYVDACLGKPGDPIPPKAVVVTFDDGHRGNHELLPLLKRYGIPATIFLCAGIVGTNRHYWFSKDHPDIDRESLKKRPTAERLALLEEVGFAPTREYPAPEALDRAQIEDLATVADMQSHTVFHPCLTRCTDREARREIEEARETLRRNYGFDIWALAYPNGDHSERIVNMTRNAGYECGLTLDFGFNSLGSDLFRLKRIDPNDADTLDEFVVKSSGVWDAIKMWLLHRGPGSGSDPREAGGERGPRG